jgi:hypothetical protein
MTDCPAFCGALERRHYHPRTPMCGGRRPPHRLRFPPAPPHRGFVHFPLQRRDVGKGAEHVGAVQAVAHRFLTSDPPQRLNRPPLCFTRWGGENLSLQNLRGWRINFGIRHEFHELARILFLLIRVNSCNSWQKRP